MSTGIFNPDHYPTPAEVAAEMLDSLDLRGKTVLEPSAGSGNLVRECLDRGAAEVLWCESPTFGTFSPASRAPCCRRRSADRRPAGGRGWRHDTPPR
jgi:hypothetical protein